MSISWSSISAGAMTAAVTLGSAVQSVGAAATQVTAGGLQAVTHQAAAVASTAVNPGAAGLATAHVVDGVSLLEKPAKALATAAPRASFLVRTAGFLSKALPIITIGASALAGAQIVNDHGAQALLTTKQGRGAVLGAIGGGLLLVPTPVTQLAAAGVLGAVAVNQFGGLDRLDTMHVRAPWDHGSGAAQASAT